MKLIDSIVAQASGMAQIRRDIHAHPELCFEEVRTADVVAAKLTEWVFPFIADSAPQAWSASFTVVMVVHLVAPSAYEPTWMPCP